MHTFTALFDRQADAEAVQAKLEQLGIIDLNHDVHSQESAGFDPNAYSDHQNPGLWESKADAAPPAEDRHLYEEAMRRGGFLLTVNSDDAEAPRVLQVLEGSEAVDMVEREQELRSAGFVPPVAAPPVESDDVISVVEERLRVGKRQVDRGGVRVRAYVVETPVEAQVALREEHVDVARRALNTPVAAGDDLFQTRSIELTETAEEVVVGKETRVVEELALRKSASDRVETIEDKVRHTEVEVEQIATDPSVRR